MERLRREYQELAAADPGDAAELARPPSAVPATDHELDATSRRLLMEVEDLRRLEREKRRTPRSSPEFHLQAEAIEAKARAVFSLARDERSRAARDSPDPSERAERRPGDWSDGDVEAVPETAPDRT